MNDDFKKKFIDFYEKEADSVFRFCLARVNDRELAKDLVQDAFLRFWNTLKKEIPRNEKVLLYTIARNLIIDWYRKKKTFSLDSLLDLGEDAPIIDIPDDAWTSEDSRRDGRFALAKINELPKAERDIVYMRFVDGLGPKEIAEILSLSANSVSVRLNRAIERLREIMKIDK